MEDRNEVRKFTLSNFKMYYKAIIIKMVSYGHKNWHVDQWNKTESPQINILTYSQLIFRKGARIGSSFHHP